MKITSLIFCIIFLLSCTRKEKKEIVSTNKNDSIISNKNSYAPECVQKDTITKMGTKIHYLFQNGNFQISWGDNTYHRLYDSLYTCDYDWSTGLWDFVPKYNSETKNFLVLTNIVWTSSGGNPAPLEYRTILLPKNLNGIPFEKEFFINCEKGYLIYGGDADKDIQILNIETNQLQEIDLQPDLYLSRSPTLGIRETHIDKNIFTIKYETLNKNNEVEIIKKVFKLNI